MLAQYLRSSLIIGMGSSPLPRTGEGSGMTFGGRVLHVGIRKGFLMQYHEFQTFGNIRPGFGYESAWQRQGLALNELDQQPELSQPEETHLAWSAWAHQPQNRPQIGQIGQPI